MIPFLLGALTGVAVGIVIPPAVFMWLVVREFNNAHRMYRSARMVQEAYTGSEEE